MIKNNLTAVIFLFVVVVMGCKKDNSNLLNQNDECVLTSLTLGSPNFKRPFFYNNNKQLVATIRNADGRLPRTAPQISIPVLDTIIYENNKVTIYSLDITGGYDSINIPQHKPVGEHFEKIVGEYVNGKITTVNYYSVSRGVDYFKYKKEIEYLNDKISQVKITGKYDLCSSGTFLPSKELNYTYNYLSKDSAIIIGTATRFDDTILGRDTFAASFQVFKNPLSRPDNLPILYGNFIFDYIFKYESRDYFFGNDLSSYCASQYRSFFNGNFYTDNGKGYPKELGVYKCD